MGTSRGHCGQQSYFCSATGPPGVDAHSFIWLPASRVGDTHRDKNVHTPTCSCQWTISRSGTCSIWWNLLWQRPSCQCFFVTWGYLCLFSLYMSVFIWELPAGVWAEGRWKHTWFWVTSCLRHTVSLSVSVSLAGSTLYHGYWITLAVYFCFFYRWFTVAYRHGCTLFAIATT